jgi:TonB family protein
MKSPYIYFPLILLISACGSIPTKLENVDKLKFIDLTSIELRNNVENYWSIFSKTESRYPIEAARKGLAGCVELITIINSAGKAQGYKIISSYPKGLFDEAAAHSLSTWSWLPSDSNPTKQPVLTNIRIDYSIDSVPVSQKYLKNCPSDKVSSVHRTLKIVGRIKKRLAY